MKLRLSLWFVLLGLVSFPLYEDQVDADHVVPKAICPELQNQVLNLELLPASLNLAKSDKVTDRAKVFAKELYDSKLLSASGFDAVQRSARK